MDDTDDLFDTDFNSQTKSRLTSVFSSDTQQPTTQSLTFKSTPTQPRRETSESSIFFANPSCHLFLSEQGRYIHKRKVGVAIIEKLAGEIFSILCYKSLTEFCCTATVFKEFYFTLQGMYGYFYDDKQR